MPPRSKSGLQRASYTASAPMRLLVGSFLGQGSRGSDKRVSSRFKAQRVLPMKVHVMFPDRARPSEGNDAIHEYK